MRVNRIDLWKNIVKSKITVGRNLGHTQMTHGLTIPINQTTSVLQTNPLEPSRNTYQTQFVPTNQSSKNAYSFSFKKGVQA